MKKAIAIFLALSLALGLTACGTSEEKSITTDVSSQQTQENAIVGDGPFVSVPLFP